MKKSKLFALVLSICLVFTLFTACGDDDTNDTNSDGGVISDVVSDGDDVVDDIESGIESMIPGDASDDAMDDDLSGDASGEASPEVPTAVSPMTGKELDLSDLDSFGSESHGWGQGKNVNEDNIPLSCLEYQSRYEKLDAFFVEKSDKNVYLTFDEGYENGYTAQILDVLKEKECPAVFFVTAPYVEAEPELIKRMIDEGHVVGNHTVNHPSMPTVSVEQAIKEITGLHETMESKFQYTMTLFRPPKGEWSERTLALTQKLGYKTIFWSFAYADWDPKKQPDTTQALEKTTSATHNGAIYLLHAVSSTNTQILSDFIDSVREKGFTFKSMV